MLGLFFDTVIQIARGITGLGVGGEYPSCSTSAAEAAKYAALLIQNFWKLTLSK
jgi:hypothetical protein